MPEDHSAEAEIAQAIAHAKEAKEAINSKRGTRARFSKVEVALDALIVALERICENMSKHDPRLR